MAYLVYGVGCSDEGKGLTTERIRQILMKIGKQLIMFRVNAGTNASHRIKTDTYEMVTKHLPSCLLKSAQDEITLVIGPGMVLNIEELLNEIETRPDKQFLFGHVRIASTIPIVLPMFIESNKTAESNKKYGTTNQGTGKTNIARLNRSCSRLYDFEHLDNNTVSSAVLHDKIKFACKTQHIEATDEDITVYIDKVRTIYDKLARYLGAFCVDYTILMKEIDSLDCNMLVEGCNGYLICCIFGQHPYGTSCMTTANALLAYTNINPTKLKAIHGVMGAYFCCLNKRAFPTEITDEGILIKIRGKCNETDPAENMPRRIGWVDLPAIRKALPYGGITIHLNKLDALAGVGKIKVCTQYKINGRFYDVMPDDEYLLTNIEPIYEELDGWQEDIKYCREFERLPSNAKKYISFLENKLNIKVAYIGVGDKVDDFIIC